MSNTNSLDNTIENKRICSEIIQKMEESFQFDNFKKHFIFVNTILGKNKNNVDIKLSVGISFDMKGFNFYSRIEDDDCYGTDHGYYLLAPKKWFKYLDIANNFIEKRDMIIAICKLAFLITSKLIDNLEAYNCKLCIANFSDANDKVLLSLDCFTFTFRFNEDYEISRINIFHKERPKIPYSILTKKFLNNEKLKTITDFMEDQLIRVRKTT
mgnify:FL=1